MQQERKARPTQQDKTLASFVLLALSLTACFYYLSITESQGQKDLHITVHLLLYSVTGYTYA